MQTPSIRHPGPQHTPSRSEGPTFWGVAKAIGVGLLLFSSPGAMAASPRSSNANLFDGLSLPQNPIRPLVPVEGPLYSLSQRCYDASFPVLSPENPFDISNFNLGVVVEDVQDPSPGALQAYAEHVQDLRPPRVTPATKFPANFHACSRNERYAVGDATGDCSFKLDRQAYDLGYVNHLSKLNVGLGVAYKCERLVKQFADEVRESGQEHEVDNDEAFRGDGRPITASVDGKLYTVDLGLNPQHSENFKKAVELVEQNVLANPCFFTRPTEEILSYIKEIHEILTAGLPADNKMADSAMTPGIFRSQDLAVSHDPKMEQTPTDMAEHLRKMGVSPREIQRFKQSLSKGRADVYFPSVLDEKELALWKKLVFFPPEHSQVEPLMLDFIEQLKDVASKDAHPIALAAWFHCEIGRIHPFSDGNGRLARLLMNAVLVRGGFEPVVIPDDEAYTAALTKDGTEPGAFAKYLAGLVRSQSKGPQIWIRA